MRRLLMAFSAVVLVATLCSHAGEASSRPPQKIGPNEGEHNEKSLMRYLWPALKVRPVRIYYSAICFRPANDSTDEVILPKFDLQQAKPGVTGLTAARQIFVREKNVAITEDSSGIIRIRIGHVSDTVLQTKIANIAMNAFDQYDNILAVLALERSPEVEDAMHRLGLHRPSHVIDVLTPGPAPSRPHLPAVIKDVTLDQALDTTATIFKSVILYGICDQQREFDIAVTGGMDFDENWPKEPDGQ